MEKSEMKEIIQEMSQLLDKSGVSSLTPLVTDTVEVPDTGAVLISLKSMNAKYDKNEALAQVRTLMEKYNIQIDELLELIAH